MQPIHLGIGLVLFFSIANIPYKAILGKLIIPAIICVTLGIFNAIFYRIILIHFGSIHISGGTISFATLFVKALNTISITLLLVSTTTIDSLGKGLAFFKISNFFIILLLLMHRYIGILLSEGETVGIVGANGSGKSTLMKLITGLLYLGSGKVIVAGMEVVNKN